MDTVMKHAEEEDVLSYKFSSLDDTDQRIEFTIKGLTTERSMEDRSVYFACKTTGGEGEQVKHSDANFTMWLQGEDAINMGLTLIEHGNFALEANRVNHQLIHMMNQLQRFHDAEIIDEVEFQMIDNHPLNSGIGFRTFRIVPHWKEGQAPQYQEDFSFEKVIYWSPFEEEYHDQLDYYTRGISYSFIGYDHDEEVRVFNEQCESYRGEEIPPNDDPYEVTVQECE